MNRKTKYLVVGQGIVGTWISYFLAKENKDFIVVNDEETKAASWVASGVINPVTGRRIVQTWIIDEVLPFAIEQYKAFEQFTQSSFFENKPIILIHPSQQMKDSFHYRLTHDNVYLLDEVANKWDSYFQIPFGTGKIDQVYWIDLQEMIRVWRERLLANNQYINAKVENEAITITEKHIIWKNIEAEYIIYCDGMNSQQNKLFSHLPFAPNKGEAIIAHIPALPFQHIYKASYSIVPWKKDYFWIGSNYEWTYADALPSLSFKEKVVSFLQKNLKIPFTITDHIVGIRPANTERRPFVGIHPIYNRVAICNGMGTKGCSLSPYFSKQLIDNIESGKPIHQEASIERFKF